MQSVRRPPASWSSRFIYVGCWTLAGVYNLLREVFVAPMAPLVAYNVGFFVTWAVLGLAIMPVARALPLGRDVRGWALHIVAALVFSAADVVIGDFIGTVLLVGVHRYSFSGALSGLVSCYHLAVMTYVAFVSIVKGRDALRLARQRERDVARLEAERLSAQLHQLRAQLQPHFLFNTLHGVASRMHYDVPSAGRMVQRLADLLRLSLEDREDATVPLGRELDFVRAYLEIEQIRFEERLCVDWDIPESLRHARVPPLVLQPLVENAIKHGIAPRAAGGRVRIRAHVADRERALVLEVEDDAPAGLPARAGFGVGLSNVRRRLEAMYGAAAALGLTREAGGTVARLSMPLGVAA